MAPGSPSPEVRPRRGRTAAAAAAVVVLAAGWLVAQRLRADAVPQPLTASGTVEADETLLSAQVTGLITALPVAEGDRVTAGEVLARIDDRVLQQEMQTADLATLRTLEVEQQLYTIQSPIAGVVTREPVHLGETAVPGEVLIAVADLSQLQLTVYVPEEDLGSVYVGEPLQVTADPYPGRTFAGRVTSIAEQAEFTPRNVQTKADRLNLVFAVKASVANPDGALKPGMYVDATFAGGSRP
jgi:multidrug efflux pump subunit AcrA (membrane-fusion protein)